MWQHVKIPLKTPEENLYEVVTDKEIDEALNKTANVSIDSLYPKLVKQVKTLRDKLEVLVRAYSHIQKEKNTLIDQLNSSHRDKETLTSNIAELEEKTKSMKEDIEQLDQDITKLTLQNKQLQQQSPIVGSGASSSENTNMVEDAAQSYESKVYTDVQEKLMDAAGKEGEDYK